MWTQPKAVLFGGLTAIQRRSVIIYCYGSRGCIAGGRAFDKFDKEIAIVKRNHVMQGSKQEFEDSRNSKLHLSALSTPQILQGARSLDLYENDKNNDEKFQDIVAHASMLAERAQKRIQKMQQGLNVVKHDLSPRNERGNYRRNRKTYAGKRNKARVKDFCF